MLDRLGRALLLMPGVSFVGSSLLDPATGELRLRYTMAPGSLPSEHDFVLRDHLELTVASQLAPIEVPDLARASRPIVTVAPPTSGAVAMLPLLDAGMLIGVVTLASDAPYGLDGVPKQLASLLIDQTASAVRQVREAQGLDARADELAQLLEAVRTVAGSLDQGQIIGALMAGLGRLVSFTNAAFYAVDSRRGSLHIVYGQGPIGETLIGQQFGASGTLAGSVARAGRTMLVAPSVEDVTLPGEPFLQAEGGALLGAPLRGARGLHGVVALHRVDPFSQDDVASAVSLCALATSAFDASAAHAAALAEIEQQAAIFAGASDGLAVIDDRMTVVEANAAFARLAGHAGEQLVGRPGCDVLRRYATSPCALCEGECLIAKTLETGIPAEHVECEFVALEPGDSAIRNSGGPIPKRYVEFHVTPFETPAGRRVLLAGRDVTAARETDQMKANFLSMVSHELRAPLQTINGYLDLTLSGMAGTLSEQQHDFLRRARSGSEHLTALVDDLLLISRRDAGQFTLHLKMVDLLPSIVEIGDELELFAEDAGVHLRMVLPDHLPMIAADDQRIVQVLRNLITNAVKFTPAGGEVEVSAQATESHIVLRVSDTGMGIAPEHQRRIFERFFQIGSSASGGRFQGQGLGLAIVKIIVQGHGGTIDVRSVLNQGSTFTVILPRSPQDTGPLYAS